MTVMVMCDDTDAEGLFVAIVVDNVSFGGWMKLSNIIWGSSTGGNEGTVFGL